MLLTGLLDLVSASGMFNLSFGILPHSLISPKVRGRNVARQ